MTNLQLRTFDIPSISKFSVGFDNILDELMRVNAQQANTNYPPYNVVKHDEDHFDIEIAVAGFREGDITVTQEKNTLTIKGEQVTDLEDADKEGPTYLYRGISSRDFQRVFTLADYVDVKKASCSDGILTVKLERKVPEAQKPKKIAISYNK